MKIWAISDLHLSFGANKPMDVFGASWENYLDKIVEDWNLKVNSDDIVLIAGDISWAMRIENTADDFKFLASLKGKKVIIRGNHDYWWNSIKSVRAVLPESVFAIQNDAIKFDNFIICGTRGWSVPENNFESEQDKKIFKRELIRLELTLKTAKHLQTNNEKIICMLHFPPFNSKHNQSDFTNLLAKYDVNKVIYGHLHGKKIRKTESVLMGSQQYLLTSCDFLDNKLLEIY